MYMDSVDETWAMCVQGIRLHVNIEKITWDYHFRGCLIGPSYTMKAESMYTTVTVYSKQLITYMWVLEHVQYIRERVLDENERKKHSWASSS